MNTDYPRIVKVFTHRDARAVKTFARLGAYDRLIVRDVIRRLALTPLKPQRRKGGAR